MADRTKYNFNGKFNLAKRNLAKEVVMKYLLDNPNKTYLELTSIFDFTASNGHSVIYNEKDYNNWKKRQSHETERYFKPINHKNGKIYICNQWSITSIQPLIEFIKNKGYKIEVKSPNNPSPPINDNKIKNIILYGVPGVGKTYSHKKLISLLEEEYEDNKIFEIIELNNDEDSNEKFFTEKLYKEIQEEKRVKFITFHQSFSYEDFIEGFRPDEDRNISLQNGVFKELCEKADEDRDNKYYLVIDEINRGNISKIFGELITLIEEDKRDSLHVTLPYLKREFSIPSNLYIIGTMNSTDKSIALIDIALRRRFTFIHMKPNPELVTKYEEARELMEKLNEKLPQEYQIGHSYFMKIENKEDLAFTCKYKIKPLLEEYFYGDETQIEIFEILDNYVN